MEEYFIVQVRGTIEVLLQTNLLQYLRSHIHDRRAEACHEDEEKLVCSGCCIVMETDHSGNTAEGKTEAARSTVTPLEVRLRAKNALFVILFIR